MQSFREWFFNEAARSIREENINHVLHELERITGDKVDRKYIETFFEFDPDPNLSHLSWIVSNFDDINRFGSSSGLLNALTRNPSAGHHESAAVRQALIDYDQAIEDGATLPDLDDLNYTQLKAELLKLQQGVDPDGLMDRLDAKKTGVVKLVQDGRWTAYKMKTKDAVKTVLDAYPTLKNNPGLIGGSDMSKLNKLFIFKDNKLVAVYDVGFSGTYFRGPDNKLPSHDVVEWARKNAKVLDMEWLNASSLSNPDHVEAGLKVLHRTVLVGEPQLVSAKTDLHKINPFLDELHEMEEEMEEEEEEMEDREHLAVVKPEFFDVWKKQFLNFFIDQIFPDIRRQATLDANHPSVVAHRQLASAMGVNKRPSHGVNDAISEILTVWDYANREMADFDGDNWRDFPKLLKSHLLKLIAYIEKVSLHLASPEKRQLLHRLKKDIERI